MPVILISGVPGAGKTTVARRLAARFPRSVHIEGDLIGDHFIVNGLVPPPDEAQAQLRLRRLEVVARRDANRDKQVFEIWGHLDAELRREMPGIGFWLDTSDLSADETVDQITAALQTATTGLAG